MWVCPDTEGVFWQVTDCDDTNAEVYPGALEVCDGLDTDCDGQIAEALVPGDFPTIQSALDEGTWIDWICVESGSYRENLDFPWWDVRVESIDGPDVTIVEGDGTDSVVRIHRGNSIATMLNGFTVTGGTAVAGSGGTVRYGGGVHIDASAATLEDVVITGNSCPDLRCLGAGLAVTDGDAVLARVRVNGNSASDCERAYGVGAWFSYGELDVVASEFDANEATDCEYARGTGLHIWGADAALRNTTFRANSVKGRGALGTALALYDVGDVTLENVIVAGNSADVDSFDGALWHSGGHVTYSNVTVTGNTGQAEGAACHGVSLTYTRNVVLLENLDYSNNVVTAADNYGGWLCEETLGTSAVTVRYTNLYGNPFDNVGMEYRDGEGVVSFEPGYADTTSEDPREWDLTLDSGSALIDAGDPAISDVDGSISDIGAFGGPGSADW